MDIFDMINKRSSSDFLGVKTCLLMRLLMFP